MTILGGEIYVTGMNAGTNNVALTTTSDVRVGRGTLQIQGTTSMTLGGQLQSGPVGDWARVITC